MTARIRDWSCYRPTQSSHAVFFEYAATASTAAPRRSRCPRCSPLTRSPNAEPPAPRGSRPLLLFCSRSGQAKQARRRRPCWPLRPSFPAWMRLTSLGRSTPSPNHTLLRSLPPPPAHHAHFGLPSVATLPRPCRQPPPPLGPLHMSPCAAEEGWWYVETLAGEARARAGWRLRLGGGDGGQGHGRGRGPICGLAECGGVRARGSGGEFEAGGGRGRPCLTDRRTGGRFRARGRRRSEVD